MSRPSRRTIIGCIIVVLLLLAAAAFFLRPKELVITDDVVYGHKYGLAMTFDVFTPPNANGAAVMFIDSGGWYSVWSPTSQTQHRYRPFTDKGFTVFAVRHGSSPRFAIPEAVYDVRRCVRFIRFHAERFGIDANRIGVYGFSAGGHLALMLGTTSEQGNVELKDPVDRQGHHVQAVAAVVAPTDLRMMIEGAPDRLPAYADIPALTLDADAAALHSPLLHVTANDAPALLLAGDADDLVPVEHSRNIRQAFLRENVACKLVEFPDTGHEFKGETRTRAINEMIAWFERHLLD